MQYAGIVPNTKTNFRHQSFLYSIPPQFLSQIKIGSLVQIPFHGRKLEGIVVDFHKSQQGIEKEKIKTIANILERSVIDETHLKLSKWMSEYYLAPLSLCLFEMVALPLKKNVRIAENQPVDLKTFTNSFSSLKDLCQKVIDKEKQVIILFPYIKQAEEAFLILQKNFKKIALYHGGLSKSKRYFNFLKIKNNQIDIVIGSHLGIFAPLPRLGLTIIYNEEDDGYKNDRAPRYNVKSVAEKLRDITFSKLLLVSQTPSIESYFHFHQNKQQNIFLIKPKLQNEIKTVVVDMQNEYKNRRFSPLSQPLQRLLITNYKKGKKSILFVSRRGAASYIFCRLCGFTLSCPNCNLPLTYNIALDKEHSYFCHHCLFKTKPASSCPNCGSLEIGRAHV